MGAGGGGGGSLWRPAQLPRHSSAAAVRALGPREQWKSWRAPQLVCSVNYNSCVATGGPLPFGLPPIGLPPTGLPPFGLPPFGLGLPPFGLGLMSFGLPPFGLRHLD